MPPRQQKTRNIGSSAEEFSDVSSSGSENSDAELATAPDNWTFPVVSIKAKREEYEAALKSAQIKVGELQDQVKRLQIQNSELRANLKRKKNTTVGSRGVLSSRDKLVSQYAKKFGVMNEVFPTPAALLVKRPLTNSMDANRYTSELAELDGIIAEVYESLPEEFYDELESSIPFRTLFLKHLNSNRRSIVHQFRSSTASEIFGYPTRYYRVLFNRAGLLEFQSLMKFPMDKEPYTKYPPLLFPNRTKNMRLLFRCEELTKMLKTILFGGASISSKKQPSPRTQGRIWQVKDVTPGAIAFMAVLAIFLHSPDQEFAPVGAVTKIPYGKRFAMFKRFLLENAYRENIKNLFKWWNLRVFSFEMSGVTMKDDSRDSGMEEAEAALNSDEDFSSEEVAHRHDDRDLDDFYASEDDLPVQNAPSVVLAADFVQLTIAERSVAQMPIANTNTIAAIRVREASMVLSAVQDEVPLPKPTRKPSKSPQPLAQPGPANEGTSSTTHHGISTHPSDSGGTSKNLQIIAGRSDRTSVEDSNHIRELLEGLFVDELKTWIREHGLIIPLKIRRKGDLIDLIMNASTPQQPTSTEIETLKAARAKGKKLT